jgi:DNA-binding beta-propeller fold protein YncE
VSTRATWGVVIVSVFGCGEERGRELPATGVASWSDGAADGEGDGDGASANDDEDDEGSDKLDVGAGAGDDGAGDACPDGDGSTGGIPAGEFSYIWIASSFEGTVSKIDTKDGTELGRYRTAPSDGANPSRTSVNLYGDVAVLNRQVPHSVTKIAARQADCKGPSTSTGATDIKAWGEDDCVLWHTELPGSGLYEDGPRPVAWEGDDAGACTKNPRLWVGWGDGSTASGTFWRLDGETGAPIDEVVVSGWETSLAPIGPYGGAVDREGAFWVVGLGGPLVRIDGETLDVTYLPRPAGSYFYGIAIDAAGNPWLGDLAGVSWTYFVDAQTFRQNAAAGPRGRGIAVDREGSVWMPVHANPDPIAGQCSLAQIDGITGAVQANIALPGCVEPVGVAVDADGKIWVVDKGAHAAFKVDPSSKQILLDVDGLVTPYTYSDMTGAGLDLVVNPPTG